MTRLLAIFAVVWTIWLAGVPAKAGLQPASPCEAECRTRIAGLVESFVTGRLPIFAREPARFDDAAGCTIAREGDGPQVYALLIGANYADKNFALVGTDNDVRNMRAVLVERGVAASHLIALTGTGVTRDAMVAAMRGVLACLKERDQLLFQFSGYSAVNDRPKGEAAWIEQQYCRKVILELCDGDTVSRRNEEAYDVIGRVILEEMAKWPPLLGMLSSETRFEDGLVVLEGLSGLELSNFVTQIRNRGADVFVVLDTNYAAQAGLLAAQRDAAVPAGWKAEGHELTDGTAAETDDSAALHGSGEFAAFYASLANAGAFEKTVGELGPAGILTAGLVESLRTLDRPSVSEMARPVTRTMASIDLGGAKQEPAFEASNPEIKVLAPRAAPAPREQDIEIVSPSPKRGGSEIEGRSLTVIARYAGAVEPFKAIVDGELTDIDGNGQFRKEIDDIAGKTEIRLRVLARDWTQIASRTIVLKETPEESLAKSPGGRYLLTIANERYADRAFPALATPKADADQVARLLIENFGFGQSLPTENGGGLNLRLENAGKAQIQQVLFDLRRRLVVEDRLVVYYAGHGENDPDLGAYWVPVDGQPSADYTWVAADEKTRELRRMNAGAILVISDSCYAGGLSRGANAPPSGPRERYLLKASKLKSRQLIASGGEEPVEDAGGQGHSVFARAFIEALKHIDEPVFTASELFEQKVKPAVISAASATAEGQTPGFHRIVKAGDEPGSEFVFVRLSQ